MIDLKDPRKVLSLQFFADGSSVIMHFSADNIWGKAKYNIKTLSVYQNKLPRLLQKYQKDPTYERLFELVRVSREAYEHFCSGINNPIDFRNWNNIIRDSRSGHNKIICDVTFPEDFTFPLSLLYTGSNNYNKTDKSNIYRYFFGNNFSIRKKFERDIDDRNSRMVKRVNLISDKIKVLHGIDSKITNYKKEVKVFTRYKNVKFNHSFNPADFVDKWSDKDYPEILHVTTHLKYDENSEKYYLTFDNDRLYFDKIKYELNLKSIDRVPFVFLNTCSGGISNYKRAFSVVYDLAPRFSLGFIVTMHNVSHDLAFRVAKEFYESFFDEFNLVDSLERAKRKIIFEKIHDNKSSGLGAITYNIWEAKAELRIRK